MAQALWDSFHRINAILLKGVPKEDLSEFKSLFLMIEVYFFQTLDDLRNKKCPCKKECEF